MKVLVTGSSGHLGEALVRRLRASSYEVIGLDLLESAYTDVVGSIANESVVRRAIHGVDAVLHTATLHKPHVVTHSRQQFVDTNVSGTLALLEGAVREDVRSFVFTSSTSVFGHALRSSEGEPAVWVTEKLRPIPKNIYGITKLAAEDLCQLFSTKFGLGCVVLRTSRFFPEEDDDSKLRRDYQDRNLKANELLFRRVDLQDVVNAHLLAIDLTSSSFDRFIISATTPFRHGDVDDLRQDAEAVVKRYFPEQPAVYDRLGWRMFRRLDRVYVNDKARDVLGWIPEHDFAHVLECIGNGADPRSELARTVGAKGYHAEVFEDGPYPVE